MKPSLIRIILPSSSARLVQISHYGIILYGLVLAAFCSILNAVGLTLTWLLTILGIIVGGASVPVGLILLWGRMSTVAAVAAPWIGLACGLTAWFVTTVKRSGTINVTTTGDTTNAVAGNITSWGVGFLMAVVLSFIFPAKHVATNTRDIDRFNKIHGVRSTAGEEVKTSSPGSERGSGRNMDDKREKDDPEAVSHPQKEEGLVHSSPTPATYVPTGNELVDYLETSFMEPMDPVLVKKGERLAIIFNLVFCLVAIILVPFTLFGMKWICKCTERTN